MTPSKSPALQSLRARSKHLLSDDERAARAARAKQAIAALSADDWKKITAAEYRISGRVDTPDLLTTAIDKLTSGAWGWDGEHYTIYTRIKLAMRNIIKDRIAAGQTAPRFVPYVESASLHPKRAKQSSDDLPTKHWRQLSTIAEEHVSSLSKQI